MYIRHFLEIEIQTGRRVFLTGHTVRAAATRPMDVSLSGRFFSLHGHEGGRLVGLVWCAVVVIAPVPRPPSAGRPLLWGARLDFTLRDGATGGTVGLTAGPRVTFRGPILAEPSFLIQPPYGSVPCRVPFFWVPDLIRQTGPLSPGDSLRWIGS